jgi:hypothetical protein
MAHGRARAHVPVSRFGPDANSKAAASKVHDYVVDICSKGQHSNLMEFDQLKMAISSGDAFPLFMEGPIFHEPTFKVKKGVKGVAYNSERVPAFCDRVLWRSVAGLGGTVSMVWSAPEVYSSDHKPVAARLYLECRCISLFIQLHKHNHLQSLKNLKSSTFCLLHRSPVCFCVTKSWIAGHHDQLGGQEMRKEHTEALKASLGYRTWHRLV